MRIGIPLFLLFGLLGSAPDVHAVPLTAVTTLYFDANNNLIGQSMRYCNSNTQHQGVASRTNARWIQVSYACEGSSTHVGYGGWVPTDLKRDFCLLYEACTSLMPWPESTLPGPLSRGLYSD
ncbi:hypothetical protein [Stenotrophomonas sp. TWI809]|uniref:hypothetical protein n=1 Tax=Stenotrophomonas sp. TWI809 TaxID=3136796 RepID=UPI00320A6910